MNADIERMYQEMVDRLPQYERPRKVIAAYIDMVERAGGLFTASPMVDGRQGLLPPAVEDRCKTVIVRELKKCLKEIDDHIQGMRDLKPAK